MTAPAKLRPLAGGPAPGGYGYTFKPSLFGAAWHFRLVPEAIEWQTGGQCGRIAYSDIHRVRLSYRPTTMEMHRFRTEVWARDGSKIEFASTSWRSMVEQDRHDHAYTAFITELHRRIAEAGTTASFETGSPRLLYWPGLAIFVGVALALAGLTVRAIQVGAWDGAVLVGGLLALFLWQAGTFFRLNRPGSYSPDALPAGRLPKPRLFDLRSTRG
jgi:hypothetical protein